MIYLSIDLPLSIYLYLSTHQSTYPPSYLPTNSEFCGVEHRKLEVESLRLYLSIYLSTYLYIYIYTHSTYQPTYPPTYLPTFLSQGTFNVESVSVHFDSMFRLVWPPVE